MEIMGGVDIPPEMLRPMPDIPYDFFSDDLSRHLARLIFLHPNLSICTFEELMKMDKESKNNTLLKFNKALGIRKFKKI